MNKQADRRNTRIRRHVRLRTHLDGGPTRPRLAVFRSLHHVYAQVIDDVSGRTLAAASTTERSVGIHPTRSRQSGGVSAKRGSLGPSAALVPVRLMWSEMAMREPCV